MPYFVTGFESVAKGSEEARESYDPKGFGRAMLLALGAGGLFYVTVIGVVSYVFPWPVGLALVAMKVIPFVPGSCGRAEWLAFALWSLLGAGLWLARSRPPARGGILIE